MGWDYRLIVESHDDVFATAAALLRRICRDGADRSPFTEIAWIGITRNSPLPYTDYDNVPFLKLTDPSEVEIDSFVQSMLGLPDLDQVMMETRLATERHFEDRASGIVTRLITYGAKFKDYPRLIEFAGPRMYYDVGDSRRYDAYFGERARINFEKLLTEIEWLLQSSIKTITGMDIENIDWDAEKDHYCDQWLLVYHDTPGAYWLDIDAANMAHGDLSFDLLTHKVMDLISKDIGFRMTKAGPIFFSIKGTDGNLKPFYDVLRTLGHG